MNARAETAHPDAFATARADDLTTAEFLCAFDAFAAAVRRARGAQAHDRGLTLSQYGLLQPLLTGGGARMRELSDQAGISPSTATRILDVLERRGIVRRDRPDSDRRAVTVTLTGAGHDLLQAEDDWLRGRQGDFHASLPADEKAIAPDLLLRLAALIDELAAGPPLDSPQSGAGHGQYPAQRSVDEDAKNVVHPVEIGGTRASSSRDRR